MKKITIILIFLMIIAGCGKTEGVKEENMKLVKDGKAKYIKESDLIIDKTQINDFSSIKRESVEIESKFCNEKMRYIAIIPAKFEVGKKYPLVIFLHGLGDTPERWIDEANIEKNYLYLRNKKEIGEMVLILPDSGNEGKSWYANWKEDKKKAYEDYFLKEMLSDIEKRYPCGGSFEKRGICGFSMGGHGAMKFSLKHPELFKTTGSFAGALNIYRVSLKNKDGGIFKYITLPKILFKKDNEKAQIFINAFGRKPKLWENENPVQIVENLKNSDYINKKLFFIDVGEDDEENYYMTRQWNDSVKAFDAAGTNYQAFVVENQKHTWSYVDLRLPAMLKFHWDNLK